MRMKSVVGPEFLGSSHTQSADLGRAWMATQKIGASSELSSVSNMRAAAPFTNFRSFLDGAGSSPARLESGEPESEVKEVDSAFASLATSPDRHAKISESSSTRKPFGRSEEPKSGSVKLSIQPPIPSTAMQAMAGMGEAPIVVSLPNAPVQRARPEPHPARPQTALGVPPMAPTVLHPSMGEMRSTVAPEISVQTLPTSQSDDQTGQTVKRVSESLTSSTVRVSSTIMSPVVLASSGEASTNVNCPSPK